MQTNKKSIELYLSKLKQPDMWVKILNPWSVINIFKPRSNSFPLNDAKTIKEFKIIDEILKESLSSMKTNVPIS